MVRALLALDSLFVQIQRILLKRKALVFDSQYENLQIKTKFKKKIYLQILAQ